MPIVSLLSRGRISRLPRRTFSPLANLPIPNLVLLRVYLTGSKKKIGAHRETRFSDLSIFFVSLKKIGRNLEIAAQFNKKAYRSF
jgi:hypothetical protein